MQNEGAAQVPELLIYQFRGNRWRTAASLDSDRQPLLHFTFHPANGAQTNFYSAGKALLRLQLINYGSAQAGDPANLCQSKYLQQLV
jgi:hypothetical protein